MLRLGPLCALVFSLLALSGCGGAGSAALVRYLHASSDLPAVDILVNGSASVTNIRYKGFTEYRGLGSGTATIRVRQTGTSTILAERQVSVSNGQELTVVLTGKAAPGAGEPSLRLTVYNDDRSAPGNNLAEYRVIHASSENPGPMDVYIVEPNQDQNSAGVNPTFNNIDFGVATNYLERISGDRRVIVTPSGNRTTTLYDTGSGDLISFGNRAKRTLVLVDGNVPTVMDRPVILPDRDGGIL
jgi:hypothetical protein